MSHVDEGTIHAWLDGALAPEDPERAAFEAHIRECAECRDRVEAERRVRDRAAAVLEQVRPDNVRVEPFAKILAARRGAVAGSAAGAAREGPGAASGAGTPSDSNAVDGAEATPDITPRRTFRIPMAIAATLVLATTATWMARRIGRAPAQPRTAVEADAARAPALGGAEMNRVAPSAQNAPATLSAAPSEQKASAERGTAAADRQIAAGGFRAADSVAGLRAQARAQEPPPVLAIVEPPERSRAETRRIDSLARASGAAGAVGRNERVAQEGVAAGGELADAIADPFAARVLESTIDWQTVDAAEAARRLGRVPASIPDLAVDSLQAGAVEGRAVIRLVQTTIAGEHLELVQWAPVPASAITADERPKAAAPSPPVDAMAKRDDRASLASYRFAVPGGVVVLRGALPADSLAALARRVRQ